MSPSPMTPHLSQHPLPQLPPAQGSLLQPLSRVLPGGGAGGTHGAAVGCPPIPPNPPLAWVGVGHPNIRGLTWGWGAGGGGGDPLGVGPEDKKRGGGR